MDKNCEQLIQNPSSRWSQVQRPVCWASKSLWVHYLCFYTSTTDRRRVRQSAWRHFRPCWRRRTCSGRSRWAWSSERPASSPYGPPAPAAWCRLPASRRCTTWPTDVDFRSGCDTWESVGDLGQRLRHRRRRRHQAWLTHVNRATHWPDRITKSVLYRSGPFLWSLECIEVVHGRGWRRADVRRGGAKQPLATVNTLRPILFCTTYEPTSSTYTKSCCLTTSCQQSLHSRTRDMFIASPTHGATVLCPINVKIPVDVCALFSHLSAISDHISRWTNRLLAPKSQK